MNLATTAAAGGVPATPTPIPPSLDPSFSPRSMKPVIAQVTGYAKELGATATFDVNYSMNMKRTNVGGVPTYEDAIRGAILLTRNSNANHSAAAVVLRPDGKYEYGLVDLFANLIDGNDKKFSSVSIQIAGNNENFKLQALVGAQALADARESGVVQLHKLQQPVAS